MVKANHALSNSAQFVKCCQIFLELNTKDCIKKVREKKKKVVVVLLIQTYCFFAVLVAVAVVVA